MNKCEHKELVEGYYGHDCAACGELVYPYGCAPWDDPYDYDPPWLTDHARETLAGMSLTTGMTADEKRAQAQQKRGRGRPVAYGRDARIMVREKSGRTYLEVAWTGDRKHKCFPNTAEGWAAARAWRDSEVRDG